MERFNGVKLFSTEENFLLTKSIFSHLRTILPDVSLGKTVVNSFSNGNLQVQVENVRGNFVVVIHSQGEAGKVHDSLFELFALLHAIVNARPADVLLVLPYMPYSRSDRKNNPRISVLGEFLPKIISKVLKINRVLLIDPHDDHVKHYFQPAADQISATYLLADKVNKMLDGETGNPVVVFPDAGAAKRFEKFPELINTPTAYIDKGRIGDDENPIPRRIIGEVEGKIAIMPDDEILTGKTAIREGKLVKKEGAKKVWMVAVHPVFGEGAVKGLSAGPFEKVIVAETIPRVKEKIRMGREEIFEVVSARKLIAEAIKRIVRNESLTALHSMEAVKLYL